MSEQITNPQCSSCGAKDKEIRLVDHWSEEDDFKKSFPIEKCHNCTVNPDEDHQWDGYEDTTKKELEEWWAKSSISTPEQLAKLRS